MPDHAKAIEAAARAMAEDRGINPDCLYQHQEWEDWPVDERVERLDPFTREPRTDLFHRAWRTYVPRATAAITAFLRSVEPSPAMIEAGPRAYAEHFSSHTGPAVFGESMAEAFQAMSATLANEVEQG